MSPKKYNLWLNRAKMPIFSSLSFAAIFFIIYADSIISNFSLQSVATRTNEIAEVIQPRITVGRIRSTFTHIPLLYMQEEIEDQNMLIYTLANETIQHVSIQEKTEEVDVEEDQINPFIPPENVTREERIVWFRRKLPELEIFHSNNLTQQFHSRILEFLNHKCSVQFYMVWLSPANTFGKRDFLGLETLFKSNPQACLMIISKTMDSKRGYRILKPLLDLGFKILAVTPDLPFLVKNTPAEAWFEEMKSGNKDPGYIPLSQNLSNLIRLAVLYKYGGVYLDADFIILKDFSGLRNSIGAQSFNWVSRQWTRLNGAVMIFDLNHPLLVEFLQEFATTFNGNKWGHNGPYLVSRVIERVGANPEYNLSVLPPRAFYPVDWNKIWRYFKKPENEEDSRWAEETLRQLGKGTYGIHLWNKRSRDLRIEEGSVMEKIISDLCIICQHIYDA